MLLLIPHSTLTGWKMVKIRTRKFFARLMILFVLAACGLTGCGTQKQASDEELVKQTQNPVADLISVPLQNNFNFGTGSKNRTVYVGNIQPVIPIHSYRRLESDHAHHHADHQSTVIVPRNGQRNGAWRHQPDVFFLAGKARRADLGRGADIHFADRHRQADRERQI